MDRFGPGSTALKKEKAVNEYFRASYSDLVSREKWEKHDTSALISAAHFVFRHALLDRLAFSIVEAPPSQLMPQSELPKMPKKFSDVC